MSPVGGGWDAIPGGHPHMGPGCECLACERIYGISWSAWFPVPPVYYRFGPPKEIEVRESGHG